MLVLPFLIYYIVYPGGKKRWDKRKQEIDQHQEIIDTPNNELHDFNEYNST